MPGCCVICVKEKASDSVTFFAEDIVEISTVDDNMKCCLPSCCWPCFSGTENTGVEIKLNKGILFNNSFL